MILSTFIEICNFLLLLITIQNISAAFWSLLNSKNFGLIIQKRCRKTKKSTLQLPTLASPQTFYFWVLQQCQCDLNIGFHQLGPVLRDKLVFATTSTLVQYLRRKL